MDYSPWGSRVRHDLATERTLGILPLKAVLEGDYDKNVDGNDDDDFRKLLIPVELNGVSYNFYFM